MQEGLLLQLGNDRRFDGQRVHRMLSLMLEVTALRFSNRPDAPLMATFVYDGDGVEFYLDEDYTTIVIEAITWEDLNA